jgi:hypothetical protein
MGEQRRKQFANRPLHVGAIEKGIAGKGIGQIQSSENVGPTKPAPHSVI